MKELQEQYNLPTGWSVATIEELIDGKDGIFKDGDWIETKDQNPDGEVRLIQLADIGDGFFRNRSDRYMTKERALELNCTFLKKGDILVARMPDPLGRACVFPYTDEEKYVTVVDVAIIRTGQNGVDSRYLTHFINSPQIRKQIEKMQTGTTRKRISRGNLSTIKIPVPPLNEQIRIALKIDELFSALDNEILNLKLTQNKLKVYRQTLLKHAFNGKLTESLRKENKSESAENLLQLIESERKNRYKEELEKWKILINDLKKNEKKPKKPKLEKQINVTKDDYSFFNKIPKNWKLTKVANISFVGTGTTPLKSNSDYYKNGNIPWVTSGALNNWMINKPSDYVTERAIKETNLKIYPQKTLLVALYGEGKTRGKCSELAFDSTINQAIAAIVQRGSEEKLRKYLKFYFTKNYTELREQAVGGAQPNLNLGIIENTIVPIPSTEEEINFITDEMDSQFSIIENLEKTIQNTIFKSNIIKKSILRKSIYGKLVEQDFNDVEATELLKIISVEKKKILEEQKKEKKKTPKKREKMKKGLSIEEVLEASDKPMLSTDVWKQSKHKNNIEDFYKELKDIQSKVKEVKKDSQSLLSLIK
ncbi:restriction endonuclease subunit S [Flavobacterium jejuense]|uniref:Restriction endonuclease subunit S n=1 Tax=Flavobacterium jejuense TaxID=1544455 RepID=A0ABX0IN64_9FLAO|nr:restriction endonuclease subunit S [Flavobacterium jejuense]NHN25235.1 restriction endonuclease subunit S [Flavobacterium jejuense]